MMNCKKFQSEMLDFLPGSASGSSEAEMHLRGCSVCREEYASYEKTFGMLDGWKAPEPSAYFDQRLAVRLREVQAEPTMGWFERLQTRLLLNTGHQFRPAMAGALAVILLAGGGTLAELNVLDHRAAVEASATVNDLQILDRNEQALQQMDQLLQDEDTTNPEDSGPAAQPLS